MGRFLPLEGLLVSGAERARGSRHIFADVRFIPAKGLSVRLRTGRPLGEVVVGGRDTLGDRVILERGRRRCNCAIDLWGCHDRMKDGEDEGWRRALC